MLDYVSKNKTMVKSVIYLLFSYQTGYIMWHSPKRIYITSGLYLYIQLLYIRLPDLTVHTNETKTCKYRRKEIRNVIVMDLYYLYYYVWPNVHYKCVLRLPDSTLCTTISIAWKETRHFDPTEKSRPILPPRL